MLTASSLPFLSWITPRFGTSGMEVPYCFAPLSRIPFTPRTWMWKALATTRT